MIPPPNDCLSKNSLLKLNYFFLFHTISSTAVPVSLIISSQVAVQSGESMDSEALQENPVTIVFIVEGVGCLTVCFDILTATFCVDLSFMYAF